MNMAAKACLVALACFAGGCAPGFGLYDKPGLTYPEWRRDHEECERAAALDRDAYDRCMRARGYTRRGD